MRIIVALLAAMVVGGSCLFMAMGLAPLGMTQTAAQVIGWLAFFITFLFILVMAAIRNQPSVEPNDE